MNRKNNSLHNATEERIRNALCFYINKEEMPTVSGICKHADINRATFYRHYIDMQDLMEKTIAVIFDMQGLFSGVNASENYISRDSLQILTRTVYSNKAFFKMYLGMPEFARAGHEQIWQSYFVPMFRAHGVKNERHMKYYHSFYIAGLMEVLLQWLEHGEETPDEMAEILWHYTNNKN